MNSVLLDGFSMMHLTFLISSIRNRNVTRRTIMLAYPTSALMRLPSMLGGGSGSMYLDEPQAFHFKSLLVLQLFEKPHVEHSGANHTSPCSATCGACLNKYCLYHCLC